MVVDQQSHSETASTVRTDFVLIGLIMVGALYAVTLASQTATTARNIAMFVSIFLGMVFVLVATEQDATPRAVRWFPGPSILLVVYLLLMVIANIVSGGGGDHLVPFIGQLVATALFFYIIPVILVRDTARLEFFYDAFIVCAVFTAISGIASYFGLQTFFFLPLAVKDVYADFSGFAAVGGIVENPLVFGVFMFLALVLTAYRTRQNPSLSRYILLMLFSGALIASQARGALLALGVTIFVAICPRFFIRSGWRLLLLVPIFLGTLLLAYFVVTTVPGLSSLFRVQMGLSDRAVIWAATAFMILRQPWFGYGFGTSSDFVRSIGDVMQQLGSQPVAAVHNTYLTNAFEQGLLCSTVYVALYLLPIWAVAQSKMKEFDKRFFIGTGLGILVANIWLDNNYGGMRITSLMLTVLMGLAYQFAITKSRTEIIHSN